MPHPIPLELSLSHEVVPGILGLLLGRKEQRLPGHEREKGDKGQPGIGRNTLDPVGEHHHECCGLDDQDKVMSFRAQVRRRSESPPLIPTPPAHLMHPSGKICMSCSFPEKLLTPHGNTQ